jgi:hypothetical protein
MGNRNREPDDLTRRELVEFVSRLRQALYGDARVGDQGDVRPVWDPRVRVNPAEFLDWVQEEMRRVGLVPRAGPRRID